eukprot:CAMPEP_0115317342 /NCGR_PEP_ID=MMETSP0270-20121206/78605_1 /TAXON_ID=71861 /ORGANISM="Scrippsiella trochoidea, Strain CCMP3099" /LENGTH=120 /DNA_ID=CAMNT_0002736809 /DNA_START=181 /DNA_END=543 /DNA_ORIENTATION=+
MPKVRLRASKGRRESLQKLASRIIQNIERDPDIVIEDFQLNEAELPGWIHRSPMLLEQLRSKVNDHIATLMRSRINEHGYLGELVDAHRANLGAVFGSSSSSGFTTNHCLSGRSVIRISL